MWSVSTRRTVDTVVQEGLQGNGAETAGAGREHFPTRHGLRAETSTMLIRHASFFDGFG